jgi:hypothetical protein
VVPPCERAEKKVKIRSTRSKRLTPRGAPWPLTERPREEKGIDYFLGFVFDWLVVGDAFTVVVDPRRCPRELAVMRMCAPSYRLNRPCSPSQSLESKGVIDV